MRRWLAWETWQAHRHSTAVLREGFSKAVSFALLCSREYSVTTDKLCAHLLKKSFRMFSTCFTDTVCMHTGDELVVGFVPKTV
jgi:hypothetical protein